MTDEPTPIGVKDLKRPEDYTDEEIVNLIGRRNAMALADNLTEVRDLIETLRLEVAALRGDLGNVQEFKKQVSGFMAEVWTVKYGTGATQADPTPEDTR
jgi:hypothetical protein